MVAVWQASRPAIEGTTRVWWLRGRLHRPLKPTTPAALRRSSVSDALGITLYYRDGDKTFCPLLLDFALFYPLQSVPVQTCPVPTCPAHPISVETNPTPCCPVLSDSGQHTEISPCLPGFQENGTANGPIQIRGEP